MGDGGVCAEIGCLAAERWFDHLKAPVRRIDFRHPDARRLHAEQFYYPNVERMSNAIRELARTRAVASTI
jgi:pyruvate/2-oxoglutarate/acetoin dehydrogenase E1 component